MRNARESFSRAFFMFYNIFLNIISKILAFASPTGTRTAAVTQNGSMDLLELTKSYINFML